MSDNLMLESISSGMLNLSSKISQLEVTILSLKEIQEIKLDNAINIHDTIRQNHECQIKKMEECIEKLTNNDNEQQHDIDYGKGAIKLLGVISIILSLFIGISTLSP